MRQCRARCAIGLAASLSAVSAWPAACFLSPKGEPASAATVVQDGRDQISLSGPRAFDKCERVVVTKGVAVAQYLDKQGRPTTEVIAEGKGITASNLDTNAAPVRAVSQGLLAMLTDPKERSTAGQKFFDKPSQVGAPFGDVYLPPEGLAVRFFNLEGDARVRIADAGTDAVVLEAPAAQGLTLDRARLRAGGKYSVRVLSSRDKLPPGAFEVVAQDLSIELDQALKAIEADPLLDANTRPLSRALVFEREGLSFNREIALREMKR